MIKPLTCDVKRRIYMSYGSRQRSPESRTAQPGSRPAARTRTPARGRRASRPGLFHLQAPSLSLPRTGSAAQAPSPGRRCQSVLHRQTLAQSGRPTPGIRRFHRIDLERNRQPWVVGGPAPRGRPWLSARRAGHARCGGNITLIGCPEKLAQVYACWCRTGPAGQPRPYTDEQEMLNDQSRRDLRPGILGSP